MSLCAVYLRILTHATGKVSTGTACRGNKEVLEETCTSQRVIYKKVKLLTQRAIVFNKISTECTRRNLHYLLSVSRNVRSVKIKTYYTVSRFAKLRSAH